MNASQFRIPLLKTTLIAALLLNTSLLQAQVYRWKDSEGRTVISDTPQKGAGQQAPVIQSAPKSASHTPAKNLAEQELALKKRQQEQKEKAKKEADNKAESAQKTENCTQAKRQLELLESGERLATRGADGEREYFDDERRAQEAEKARKRVQEWCN